jgi:hypothetical protein
MTAMLAVLDIPLPIPPMKVRKNEALSVIYGSSTISREANPKA